MIEYLIMTILFGLILLFIGTINIMMIYGPSFNEIEISYLFLGPVYSVYMIQISLIELWEKYKPKTAKDFAREKIIKHLENIYRKKYNKYLDDGRFVPNSIRNIIETDREYIEETVDYIMKNRKIMNWREVMKDDK